MAKICLHNKRADLLVWLFSDQRCGTVVLPFFVKVVALASFLGGAAGWTLYYKDGQT